MEFVLASASPRRRQLFALGNWGFEVIVSDVDETPLENESPPDYVSRLAKAKALAIRSKVKPEALIIGSDTTVVDGQEILGKPVDEKDAERMLKQLRGKNHQVLTAIAIYRVRDEKLVTDLCSTDVPMRNYSDDEIKNYIKTGDPMDKAGAYAIQHPEFQPVEKMQGCYASVMGLPMCHIVRALKQFDIFPNADVPVNCQSFLNYDCKVYSEILNPIPNPSPTNRKGVPSPLGEG
ncbi:MAG: septum formation protein Maf [Anaerolineales bacterium]|nr:septum formation protein Maf [Anaerolineales bacterium]